MKLILTAAIMAPAAAFVPSAAFSVSGLWEADEYYSSLSFVSKCTKIFRLASSHRNE
jgi:hypothetical protein